MKISEIFKRRNTRESAGQSTEPNPFGMGTAVERKNLLDDNQTVVRNEITTPGSLKPIALAGSEECNCAQKLNVLSSPPKLRIPSDASSQSINEQLESIKNTPYANKEYKIDNDEEFNSKRLLYTEGPYWNQDKEDAAINRFKSLGFSDDILHKIQLPGSYGNYEPNFHQLSQVHDAIQKYKKTPVTGEDLHNYVLSIFAGSGEKKFLKTLKETGTVPRESCPVGKCKYPLDQHLVLKPSFAQYLKKDDGSDDEEATKEAEKTVIQCPSQHLSSKDFHKQVVSKWLGMMNETDDKKRHENVNVLQSLKRTNPTADNRYEFQNHLLMHLYNAGMSHRDLGIKDSELGEQFKQTQGLSQAAQNAAKSTHQYNQNNCGVCQQYLDSLKNHVRKYKDGIDNISMMTTKNKPEDSGKSADELVKSFYDDYQTGNKSRTKDSSAASAIDTLSNWDKHCNNAHGYSFNSDYDKYTPVARDKSFIRSTYDRLKGYSGGWSRGKNVPLTGNPFEERKPGGELRTEEELSTKEKKKVDIIKTRQKFQEPSAISTRETLYPLPPVETKGMTADEAEAAYENRRSLLEKDEQGQSILTPIQKRKDTGGTLRTVIELPNKTITYFPQQKKYNQDFSENTVGGPFSVTPKPPVQTYNAADDPRNKLFQDVVSAGEHPEIIKPSLREGINATLPRQHKYLFQKAGIEPETAGLKEHAKKLRAFKSQPTHTTIDTGRTETVEEPQFEQKGFFERDGKLLPHEETYQKEHIEFLKKLHTEGNEYLPLRSDGKPAKIKNLDYDWTSKKDDEWIKDWHSKNSKENLLAPIQKTVPKLDKNGKQITKTVTKSIYEERPIPAEQMIPEPSQESLANAQSKYNESFNNALSKVYPNYTKEQAMNALQNEHEGVVNNLEKQHQRSLQTRNRRINASKETIMFNSKNKKESHIDLSVIPGMVEHGIKDVGHMLNTVRNQWDQARQNTNQSMKGDATVQLLGEAAAAGFGGKKLLDKYKNWVNTPGKRKDDEEDGEAPRQASLRNAKAKLEAAKKSKTCEKCGKKCSDNKECKANIEERRRSQSADNAYND
jgi:hypothetical protein